MAEAFDHSLCAELGEEVESVERITNFTYVVECALPTICDPIDDCNLGGIFDAIGIAGVGTQGPQGPQGPADGPQGSQGPQGDVGAQGTPGVNGAQGATGAQGPQGANGSAGAQGPQGHQGTQGPQGHQGTQGPQGDGGSSGFSIGTLAATMQRADTGKAFTTTAGDSACTSVGDYTSQLPGGITLSIGTTLAAHKVGANWSIWPPGYLFTLKGSCGTITAGGSGSVVTSYGTVTAYNDSPYSTASGWCVIAWDEPNNRWMIVNFDPVCP